MRARAEWLVLPLLFLPVAAVLGLALWARAAHEVEMAPYRVDPRGTAGAWLSAPEGPAQSIPERVLQDYAPGWVGFGAPEDYVAFDHPLGAGRVRLRPTALGHEPWSFAAGYPRGLPAEALVDPAVRLQVEAGRSIAELPDVDADAAVLPSLLDTPDVETLRTALLPASTKAFLLRRWRRRGHEGAPLDEAETLVRAVRDHERATSAHGAPLPLGAHACHGTLALASGGVWPTLLFPDEGSLPAPRVYAARLSDEDPVRLAWVFPPGTATGWTTLWRGRVEQPLAGTVEFGTTEGAAWWQAQRVRRWAGPIGLVLLGFLCLPVALWVVLRRRRRLDEARVRFVNEMAHDLRTPLASLRLHVDMLCEGKGHPDQGATYLRTLSREAGRLSSLLANLLDLSRLDEGRRGLEVETFDVAPVVEQVAADFAAIHADRRDDLEVEGHRDTTVRADRNALERALANLLENAGKYTEPGTRIRVTWSEEGKDVRVLVGDEGPGVPPRERSRVFERYARGDRARRDGIPGTGLGLALVRELVEGMGGHVELAESERGATFSIRLPGASRA